MSLLAGRWKLVYTNSPPALAVLGALRALPAVTIGDITQHVDGDSLEVQNKVEVAVPFMLSLSAHAGFEVKKDSLFLPLVSISRCLLPLHEIPIRIHMFPAHIPLQHPTAP